MKNNKSNKTKAEWHWKKPMFFGAVFMSVFMLVVGIFALSINLSKSPNGGLNTNIKNVQDELTTAFYKPTCHLQPQKGSIVIDFINNKALVSHKHTKDADDHFRKNVAIPKGKYRVLLEAFDGYDGRANTPVEGQRQEQYSVEFHGGPGNAFTEAMTLAYSGTTPDLADGVDSASWHGVVNESLTFSDNISYLIVKHINPYFNKHPNSVKPVCMRLDSIDEPAVCATNPSQTGSKYQNTSFIVEPSKTITVQEGEKINIKGESNISGVTGWRWIDARPGTESWKGNRCYTADSKNYDGVVGTVSNKQNDSIVLKRDGRTEHRLCLNVRDANNHFIGAGCVAQRVVNIEKGIDPVCGDGKVNQSTEQCDLGSNKNGKVCTPAYNDNCTYCDSSCQNKTVVGPNCGDGKVEEGKEECDDGIGKNGVVPTVGYGEIAEYCKTDCTKATVKGGDCGNGKVEADEDCDDGNLNNGDGCSSTCQFESLGITLTKTPSDTLVKEGKTVTYTYKVTSNSPAELKNIKLTDDKLGNITCPKTVLTSGESMTCTKSTKITKGVVNKATVRGVGSVSGKSVVAYAQATVNVKDKPTVTPEKKKSCKSSIGNYIWLDANGNGVQEEIEEGIAGIKVCAFNGNKKYCDTTNKSGRYKIKNLCKGSYDVFVKGVGSMIQTYDPDGKKDNKTEVKLKKNDKYTKADFGYKGLAPATGLGTNIALLIGLSTLITLGILVVMRRKGAL